MPASKLVDHATCATPSIAHDLEVNSSVCGFPFWAEKKFSAHNILSTQSITELNPAFSKIPLARHADFSACFIDQLAQRIGLHIVPFEMLA